MCPTHLRFNEFSALARETSLAKKRDTVLRRGAPVVGLALFSRLPAG